MNIELLESQPRYFLIDNATCQLKGVKVGLFIKSVEESRIIDSDETLQWHIEN
jgi:hypothetical protein